MTCDYIGITINIQYGNTKSIAVHTDIKYADMPYLIIRGGKVYPFFAFRLSIKSIAYPIDTIRQMPFYIGVYLSNHVETITHIQNDCPDIEAEAILV